MTRKELESHNREWAQSQTYFIPAPKMYLRTSSLMLPHSIPLFTSPEKGSIGHEHHNSSPPPFTVFLPVMPFAHTQLQSKKAK